MANTAALPGGYDATVARLRQHDMATLAPKFRERVEAAVTEANAAGFDAVVFETGRSDELARLYFEHGVSNAKDALHTWHHYGLAVDVISKAREWKVYPGDDGPGDPAWVHAVEAIFKRHGLDWGGDWHSIKDWPHWQFGGMHPSPVDAPRILATQGIRAVWAAVGAL